MMMGRVIVVLGAVALGVMFGCSKNSVPGDVQRVWDSYVAAVHTGDEAAGKALFTAESAPYFELDDTAAAREASYTLVRVEPHESYDRLQVLVEWDSLLAGRNMYLVRDGDALRFQYPFVIFAADWPTEASSHLTFHIDPMCEDSLELSGDDATSLDTAPYEEFIACLKHITEFEPARRIEYYLCGDTAEVSLLSGRIGAIRTNYGPCIFTTRRHDLSMVAAIILEDQPEDLDFLRLGLIGYGEHERIMLKAALDSKRSLYEAGTSALSGLTSEKLKLLIDGRHSDNAAEHEWSELREAVAMVMISELVRRDSANMLATLYHGSHTADDFHRLFDSLYSETPYDLLQELWDEYAVALEETAKAQEDSTNGDAMQSK